MNLVNLRIKMDWRCFVASVKQGAALGFDKLHFLFENIVEVGFEVLEVEKFKLLTLLNPVFNQVLIFKYPASLIVENLR